MIKRSIIFIGAVFLIALFVFYIESKKPKIPSFDQEGTAVTPTQSVEEKDGKYPVAREIIAPAGFINTEKVSIQDLVGEKVILLDFWTYSCINCQRTLPYLNGWYGKYRDQGLEIIGVHTPEFEFEKIRDNVLRAVAQYGIKYPVVLDNDYGTWRNYGNRYWPRKYLIDIDGFIVYDHIGEGGYDETEKKIQELLREKAEKLKEDLAIPEDMLIPSGAEAVDSRKDISREIYFGSGRNTYFANGTKGIIGRQTLNNPSRVDKNALYLVGDWDIQSEYAQNLSAGAKIIFRYQAQKVFMVASAGSPVEIEVRVDGEKIESSGQDLNSQGRGIIQEDRLYRLIESGGYEEKTLEIIIKEPGLKAFTFTFG